MHMTSLILQYNFPSKLAVLEQVPAEVALRALWAPSELDDGMENSWEFALTLSPGEAR